MREILFRGKNDAGEWLYGYLTKPAGNPCFIIDGDEYFGGVIEETIGQYTGLKDKNRTKIFEGDIIKIPEDWDKYGINAGELFEVYFDYGGFRLKPKIYKDCRGFWLEDDGEFEIISNIHDNHKLLEEV
jgi:uncharacterized phage protein (TIGR01671 family)